MLGGEPQDKEQLLDVLKDAKERELLDTDALSMIEGVLQVSDLRVRDIMIPRAEMVSLRRDDPLDKILEIAVKSAHSRFPVTGDDKGEVVGILLAKDLLSFCRDHGGRAFNIRDLLRSAVFVPESKRLNVLLKEFRSSRNHMAIVIDEYGSAGGLVTIEDVLEQIVGEIDDEHDDAESELRVVDERTVVVDAKIDIEEVEAHFRLSLPEGPYESVGGFIIHRLGKVPPAGVVVQEGPLAFKVLGADQRRIKTVRIVRSDDPVPQA